MTILEACVRVLTDAGQPLRSEQIFEGIQREGLYKFGAKDPLSIVRGTLRKHLRSPGPHKIEEKKRNLYVVSR